MQVGDGRATVEGVGRAAGKRFPLGDLRASVRGHRDQLCRPPDHRRPEAYAFSTNTAGTRSPMATSCSGSRRPMPWAISASAASSTRSGARLGLRRCRSHLDGGPCRACFRQHDRRLHRCAHCAWHRRVRQFPGGPEGSHRMVSQARAGHWRPESFNAGANVGAIVTPPDRTGHHARLRLARSFPDHGIVHAGVAGRMAVRLSQGRASTRA